MTRDLGMDLPDGVRDAAIQIARNLTPEITHTPDDRYAALGELVDFARTILAPRVEARAAVTAALEQLREMDAAGPDAFKTGQNHLSPAFREVNWQSAFTALAQRTTALQEAVESLLDPS